MDPFIQWPFNKLPLGLHIVLQEKGTRILGLEKVTNSLGPGDSYLDGVTVHLSVRKSHHKMLENYWSSGSLLFLLPLVCGCHAPLTPETTSFGLAAPQRMDRRELGGQCAGVGVRARSPDSEGGPASESRFWVKWRQPDPGLVAGWVLCSEPVMNTL